ncbi:MAG TPA: amidohydrolase family protein, partial [Opitutus sp.]|nr:amidohydrolase family protein [Opitutus sp.]
WSAEQIHPFFDTVLEAFSPARLMFGSDWPVCLVAADYARWHSAVESLVQPLTRDERDAIMGGTATAFYQLAS